MANRDITALLMPPSLFNHEDDSGSDVIPPLPLAFDRVNEGRAPSSGSPLFKLPFEILDVIFQNIDSSTLPNLALVNRDCRQLARSRQFASVCLNYSNSTRDLIDLLYVYFGESLLPFQCRIWGREICCGNQMFPLDSHLLLEVFR